jgi:fructokinase
MEKGVICLGEALIDFIPTDSTNTIYKKSPGGAPANVAVGLSLLGETSTFIGKVGSDLLGDFLYQTLEEYGVNVSHIKFTKEAKTGITFVKLTTEGERSFEFYISQSADQFLQVTDISEDVFKAHAILHIGSISLINKISKMATKAAINLAKKHSLLISFDANIRHSLWENDEQIKREIIPLLYEADIVKLSVEEMYFLTSANDIQSGLKVLKTFNIPLLVITLGDEGCWVVKKNDEIHVPAMEIEIEDTTGAGDAFVSGFLYNLNKYNGKLEDLCLEELKDIAIFASICGGLAASAKGAMTSLPTLNEVHNILKGAVR